MKLYIKSSTWRIDATLTLNSLYHQGILISLFIVSKMPYLSCWYDSSYDIVQTKQLLKILLTGPFQLTTHKQYLLQLGDNKFHSHHPHSIPPRSNLESEQLIRYLASQGP